MLRQQGRLHPLRHLRRIPLLLRLLQLLRFRLLLLPGLLLQLACRQLERRPLLLLFACAQLRDCWRFILGYELCICLMLLWHWAHVRARRLLFFCDILLWSLLLL